MGGVEDGATVVVWIKAISKYKNIKIVQKCKVGSHHVIPDDDDVILRAICILKGHMTMPQLPQKLLRDELEGNVVRIICTSGSCGFKLPEKWEILQGRMDFHLDNLELHSSNNNSAVINVVMLLV